MKTEKNTEENRYWSCLIGPVPKSQLRNGEDATLRMPVRTAFYERFGNDEVCSSGWGITQERYELLRIIEGLPTPMLKKLIGYI
jgi:hypothetical protein